MLQAMIWVLICAHCGQQLLRALCADANNRDGEGIDTSQRA